MMMMSIKNKFSNVLAATKACFKEHRGMLVQSALVTGLMLGALAAISLATVAMMAATFAIVAGIAEGQWSMVGAGVGGLAVMIFGTDVSIRVYEKYEKRKKGVRR